MKNIVKMIGLLSLIGFSFFYTDKVVEVIREEDEIMIELESVKDIYKVLPVDAEILKNTIVPGLEGRVIDIDESYKKMKSNGFFNKNLIIYDKVEPDVSVHNNKDKFIIRGNNNKQMVSILFVLDSDKYLSELEKVLVSKDVIANYFVDYSFLVDNSTKIKEMKNGEFYSYGNKGEYTLDNLLFSNNLISRIRNNQAVYCLASNMEKKILKICSDNNLYTIVPSIVGDKKPYTMVKDKLSSGSIILLSMNQETIKELAITIDYIRGKGYNIGGLSTMLSETLVES